MLREKFVPMLFLSSGVVFDSQEELGPSCYVSFSPMLILLKTLHPEAFPGSHCGSDQLRWCTFLGKAMKGMGFLASECNKGIASFIYTFMNINGGTGH